MRHKSSEQTWTLMRPLPILSALVLWGVLASVSVASNVASQNPKNPDSHNNKSASVKQPPRDPSPAGPFSDIPSANLQQNTGEYNQYPSKARRYFAKVLDDPLATLTAILIGVLVWHAMLFRGSLIASKESSERQLRAYVSIHTTVLNVVERGPNQFVVQCEFVYHNTGQTPAYETSTGPGTIVVAPYPWTDATSLPPGPTRSQFTLGPSMGHSIFTSIDLVGSEMTKLRAANFALWLVGRVEYRDAFGDKRYSNYRAFIHGPLAMGAQGDLTLDQTGNDSD